jgi:hypothetical protein
MDIKEIINKMTVDKIKQPCITLHPGFSSVCLCVWVLQAAGSKHQKNRGTSINEHYRHIAYKQLTSWCWGKLGKNCRVVLPACAVKTIRNTFPSTTGYTGFK